MKGKTKKLACYMLVFSLLITSITTVYVNKPTPVKGGEIVLTYTAYEVMLAIMAGLGLSVADYGIQTSQDDLENAKAFYESCQHWEEVDKEYLNKAIETAQTTGQVVIDKASGVWEKLKAQFGEVIDKFKTPDIDESEYESYYNMGNFDNSTYHNNFYNYLDSVIFNLYNKYGVQTSGHFSDYDASYFYSSSSSAYYIIYSALQSNGTYTVHGIVCSSIDDLMKITKQIRTDLVSPTSKTYYTCSVWNFYPNPVDGQYRSGGYSSYNVNRYGQCVDLQILSPSGYENYLELKGLGMTNVSYKDNYDIVYHPPTVGDVAHAYDIITPENTAEKDEDGTYKIGGAYVIDVANPVTYPVDLTDGQTIPDEKSEIGTIPITDIVKVNEKTDTGDEDNKTEDSENTGGSTKPIVPDVSSGDIPDMAVLKTLFPFCIPFDIADSIKLMQADAVAPKWTIKINIPIGKKTIPFEFTIDMSILDEQVKIFRDGQVVIFIIGLAFATTKVIKWGASEE